MPVVEPVVAALMAAHVLTLPPLLLACLSLVDDNEEDLTLFDCNDPPFADCFSLFGRGNRFCFTTPYWWTNCADMVCPAMSTLRERNVFTGVAAIVSDLDERESI